VSGGRRRSGGGRRGGRVEGLLHNLAARRVGGAGLIPPLRRGVHLGMKGSGEWRVSCCIDQRGGLKGGGLVWLSGVAIGTVAERSQTYARVMLLPQS
jgi:hypothetical protein